MKQLSFIQLSDTHLRSNYQNDPLELVFNGTSHPADNLVKVLKSIDFEGLDFIAITGDIVHDGSAEDYKTLKMLVEDNTPPSFPVFYCLGNHDDKPNYYKGFHNIEDNNVPLDYVEEFNGYRLIFMDTSVANNHGGCLSEAQLDWLEEIVSIKAEVGSLVFMHHPLVWNGEKTTIVSDRLFDILANSDIISIHSGHLHCSGINYIGQIPQFTIDSLAFGVEETKESVNYTDRNSYNYYVLRERSIFSNLINVNPKEKVIWALTHEQHESHTVEHYGRK